MKGRDNSAVILTPRVKRLLEMQGFSDVSEERLAAIRPWLRVAPAITATWILLGTITQSPLVLWVLVPFAILGALLPAHPFDVFYNSCLRFVLGATLLPNSPLQRRICCGLSGGWAATTATFLHLDMVTAATVTGIFATVGCALPALSDYCVPSFVMNLLGIDAACSIPEPANDDSTINTWWDSERKLEAPLTRTLYVHGYRHGC